MGWDGMRWGEILMDRRNREGREIAERNRVDAPRLGTKGKRLFAHIEERVSR